MIEPRSENILTDSYLTTIKTQWGPLFVTDIAN